MKNSFILIFLIFNLNLIAQNQFSVYFESNKFELKKPEIQKLNDWVVANKDVKIVGVNGFCDEDGSTELNDTLAKKRINFVYNLIKNKVLIRDDFKTRSFGKLHQMSKIKAENRRVTLFYIEKKDIVRENDILGIAPAPVITQTKKLEIRFPERIILDNPDGTKSEIPLDVAFMKQLSETPKGEILNIKDLNFHQNTFAVTRESRAKLYELLSVMQLMPSLKIEIHGHICCNPNPKDVLSLQRAKAVYLFLVANDIEKSRMSFVGFGSSQPIFPLPEKNETERATNRRVEIKVVDK